MTKPVAYDPQEGYRFQILCRSSYTYPQWEHCDYATDKADKKHLLDEYALAYKGMGFEFMTIQLPRKYWPKPEAKVAA